MDIKALYPMDMEEFMLACGEGGLVEQIKDCFAHDIPMPATLHEAAMGYYHQYQVAGGMPDCVSKFVETHDYILVRHIQETILAAYLNDMSKYRALKPVQKDLKLAIRRGYKIELLEEVVNQIAAGKFWTRNTETIC